MSADPQLQLALAMIKDGRNEEALELLLARVEADETDADALVLLGACYGRIGQYLEAEHYLSMACEVAPRMAQAHFNLGQCFQARGRVEMAVRSYENAIRAEPGYERAWRALKALGVTLSPDLQAAGSEHGFAPVESQAHPAGDEPA